MNETADDAHAWEVAEEGAELLREGLADEALNALNDALVEHPDNAYLHQLIAAVHYEKQAFTQALPHYVKALALAPNYAGALIGCGHCLRMLGRYEEAIRVGNQALSRDLNDGDALYLLGLTHFACGNNAECIQHLKRFLESNPELETAMEVQGILQSLESNAT